MTQRSAWQLFLNTAARKCHDLGIPFVTFNWCWAAPLFWAIGDDFAACANDPVRPE